MHMYEYTRVHTCAGVSLILAPRPRPETLRRVRSCESRTMPSSHPGTRGDPCIAVSLL